MLTMIVSAHKPPKGYTELRTGQSDPCLPEYTADQSIFFCSFFTAREA